MRKIIFLDIDGVLATHRAWDARSEDWKTGEVGEFHPETTALFEKWLTEHPDVDLVLSSTWRRGVPILSAPFGWKWRIAKESKLIASRIRSTTPITSGNRGEEIKTWLEDFGDADTLYAILDDDSDMLPEQMPFFVKTLVYDGLLPSHLERIEDILGE